MDASWLTAHSDFLCEMLFDSSGHLGVLQEGTIDNPIIVHRYTVETFANFLGWLNYKYISISSLFTFTNMICIFDKQLLGATSG